jgi:hypothetical protein
VNLPLLGPQRYVLQSLSLVGDFSNDSGQGMDVGLRYSYAQDGKVVSQFYPIFAPSSGLQVEFLVNWDPLAPLNPQRSWMKFTGNSYTVTVTDEGQGKIEVAPDGNVLATWLRTIYGKPLWLRPVLTGDHAARLVMQPRPPDKPGEQAFYMVPDGDYEVLRQSKDSAENPSMTPFNLLCGLAGTESIAFPPGTFAAPETVIRFHSWKPAFAPVFPLTDAASGIDSRQSPTLRCLTTRGPRPGSVLLRVEKVSKLSITRSRNKRRSTIRRRVCLVQTCWRCIRLRSPGFRMRRWRTAIR